jgi:hypothetical protein
MIRFGMKQRVGTAVGAVVGAAVGTALGVGLGTAVGAALVAGLGAGLRVGTHFPQCCKLTNSEDILLILSSNSPRKQNNKVKLLILELKFANSEL